MSPSLSVSPDTITTPTDRIPTAGADDAGDTPQTPDTPGTAGSPASATLLPRRGEPSRQGGDDAGGQRRPRRARRNSEQTRALLLEAARRRFDRLGYDKASVRDIAADAGVSQGLIFRYFGTKEDLYRACSAYEERLVGEGVFAGPQDELGDHLLRLFRSFWPSMGDGCHPLVGLLRQPTGELPGHAHLRRRLIDELPRQFSANVPGEDAEERGVLLLAWLMGMGLMRSVIGVPALQNKSLDRLAPHFNRAVAALVADPAGDPAPEVNRSAGAPVTVTAPERRSA